MLYLWQLICIMENQHPGKKRFGPLILVGAIAALLVFGFFFYKPNKEEEIFGDNVEVIAYKAEGNTISGIASIPFTKDAGQRYLSFALDANANGKFSEDEWVVKNIPVNAKAGWNSNLPFKKGLDLNNTVKVRLVATKSPVSKFNEFIEGDVSLVKNISVQTQNLADFFGSDTASNLEESMKQGGETGTNQLVQNPLVPDFSQRPAECAPTVAANGLYSLAAKNGAADKLPKNPEEAIAGLKTEMNWTVKEGVLPDNFVAGKNKWAITHGLPIITEKIGDKDGRGTLAEIQQALANGSAVEMRIRFADSNLKAIGGHIVSVTSVREVDGSTYIDIHDPASPSGTDTYRISANEILDYPYHNGSTVVGWGFKQTWTGAPMGGNLEPMTEAEMRGIREFAGEKKQIKAIQVLGKYIPLSEVRIGKGEHCDGPKAQYPHWHSTNGSYATATDGTKMPDNSDCGYGKEKDVPVVDIEIN